MCPTRAPQQRRATPATRTGASAQLQGQAIRTRFSPTHKHARRAAQRDPQPHTPPPTATEPARRYPRIGWRAATGHQRRHRVRGPLTRVSMADRRHAARAAPPVFACCAHMGCERMARGAPGRTGCASPPDVPWAARCRPSRLKGKCKEGRASSGLTSLSRQRFDGETRKITNPVIASATRFSWASAPTTRPTRRPSCTSTSAARWLVTDPARGQRRNPRLELGPLRSALTSRLSPCPRGPNASPARPRRDGDMACPAGSQAGAPHHPGLTNTADSTFIHFTIAPGNRVSSSHPAISGGDNDNTITASRSGKDRGQRVSTRPAQRKVTTMGPETDVTPPGLRQPRRFVVMARVVWLAVSPVKTPEMTVPSVVRTVCPSGLASMVRV